MRLKHAVIAALNRELLIRICRDLGLPADPHNDAAMAEGLTRQAGISEEYLLDYLNEKQVKTVCEKYGVAVVGRRGKLIKALLQKEYGPTFVAIDFETADYSPDSACAVALVRVENHAIVHRAFSLIKPPRRKFVFTYLHGISWEDVANQPTFGELWPELQPVMDGVDFLAAHNASFDRSVLRRCCAAAGLDPPGLPFRCTVDLARKTWKIYPTKLPHVCRYLGIPLNHHEAASDAEACARIVLAVHGVR